MEERDLVNCHIALGPQIMKQINYEALILLCPALTYFTKGGLGCILKWVIKMVLRLASCKIQSQCILVIGTIYCKWPKQNLFSLLSILTFFLWIKCLGLLVFKQVYQFSTLKYLTWWHMILYNPAKNWSFVILGLLFPTDTLPISPCPQRKWLRERSFQ